MLINEARRSEDPEERWVAEVAATMTRAQSATDMTLPEIARRAEAMARGDATERTARALYGPGA